MLAVGDLVARADAPAVTYRVTTALARGVVRALPFRRAGAEVLLFTVRRGGRTALSDGTAPWIQVG